MNISSASPLLSRNRLLMVFTDSKAMTAMPMIMCGLIQAAVWEDRV